MEFSELFSFVIVLKESFLLLPKISKFTVPTTAISLILSTFSFLLFIFSYKIGMDMITSRYSTLIYIVPVLITEIVFFSVLIVSFQVSGTLTTIVSAVAYTGQTISPSDLLSRVRKTWRRSMKRSFCMSGNSAICAILVGGLTSAVIFMHLINPISIFLLVVLWTGSIIISIKSSVSLVLAHVVSVLEETSDGRAVERSEQLVEGQRLKSFMLILFLNILACVCFLIYWMILGDKVFTNMMTYGLFSVAFLALFRIVMPVTVTVLYFQCKKHRGEELDVLNLVQHTKLPASG